MTTPSVRRFTETFRDGRAGSRIAFVVDAARLPLSSPGAFWQEDALFEGETEDGHAGLRDVILAARRDGVVLVIRETTRDELSA